MDKVQLLERYFNAFINITKPRDFFIGMADYLDLTNSFPEFEHVNKDINAPKKELERRLEYFRTIALEKVLLIYKEISKYIKDKEINNREISEELKECEGWIKGDIVGSNSKPIGLHISLGDIINCLYKIPEHKDFASKYIEFYKGRPDSINRFVPIKEVWELMDLENEFKAKEDIELLGQVEDISRLYETIKRGRDIHRELKEKKNIMDTLGHGMILHEWKSIEEDKLFGQQRDRYWFKVDKVKPWLSRLHNYLLKELTLQKDKSKHGKVKEKSKMIDEIIFIEKKTQPKSTYLFYINGDLDDVRQLRGDSNRIKKLIDIIRNGSTDFDKNLLDYINSNKDCALYCAGKYDLTKILEKNGQHIKISYGVKAKVISEIEYKKKLNKKKSA